MKKLSLALALTVLGATAASAQGIQLRVGPDADRVDRPSRERVIIRERRGLDDDVVVRRRDRDVTGSTCRTVVEKRENSRGDMVTKRTRVCD